MDQHTAWVEVDLEAIRHNYRQVKEHVGRAVHVMAVVKTNGYGHGLELVGRALTDIADWFGVSTAEEGTRLRAAAITAPILVFHPVGPWNAALLVANDLTATVDSESGADALALAGTEAGVIPKAHVKVDTGMSRFGMTSKSLVRTTAERTDIQCEGIYSHLATAGDASFAGSIKQMERFRGAVEAWPGAAPRWIHMLNSSGLLRFPAEGTTMVRAGTILYGQYPSSSISHPLDLKPTWAYKARIISVRNVKSGASAGYGAEWTAKRESRLATIPVGYADGLSIQPRSVWQREQSLAGIAKRIQRGDEVTVNTPHGKAPIVGRIAAQSAILDVTELPALKLGDVVEVPARRVLVGEHIARIEAPVTDG